MIWDRPESTAEDVRNALAKSQPMKDSTVRTILRRLEEKGYVDHVTQGRTYVYQSRVESASVAADAVRSIVDRFCTARSKTCSWAWSTAKLSRRKSCNNWPSGSQRPKQPNANPSRIEDALPCSLSMNR